MWKYILDCGIRHFRMSIKRHRIFSDVTWRQCARSRHLRAIAHEMMKICESDGMLMTRARAQPYTGCFSKRRFTSSLYSLRVRCYRALSSNAVQNDKKFASYSDHPKRITKLHLVSCCQPRTSLTFPTRLKYETVRQIRTTQTDNVT